MRTVIAALACVLLAPAAHGAGPPPVEYDHLPPVEYDHPFKGEVLIIDELSQQVMKDNCTGPHGWRPGYATLGCTFQNGIDGRCVIMLAERDLIEDYTTREAAIRHEIGHCNGWGADHKGARAAPPPPDDKVAPRPNDEVASPRIVIREVSGNDLVAGRTECSVKASACVIPGRDTCVIILARESDAAGWTARNKPGFNWRAQREAWIAELATHCGSHECRIFTITAWAHPSGVIERRNVTACLVLN